MDLGDPVTRDPHSPLRSPAPGLWTYSAVRHLGASTLRATIEMCNVGQNAEPRAKCSENKPSQSPCLVDLDEVGHLIGCDFNQTQYLGV